MWDSRRPCKPASFVMRNCVHLEPTFEDDVRELKFIYDFTNAPNATVDIYCDGTNDSDQRSIGVLAQVLLSLGKTCPGLSLERQKQWRS
jgi:hypothetical protein